MTISANYPSIAPSLDLDFANSQALDPRVTFTRAATGTYYDGSTSAIAEQNLFLQSQTLGNAAWVSTNNTITTGITDPSSGTTAQTLTASAGNSTFYQTVTLTATAYTVSFYVQRVTGTGTINFTLDGTNFTAITAPTGSWVRYNITATPTAGAKTIGIQIVTSGDAINIAFGQLENRTGASGYTATTTAAITNYIPQLLTATTNQPRFDFNPITRVSLGLLMEQQSTNLLTYSSDYTNAVWAKTNATATSAYTISPDGTLNAQLLTATANGGHIDNYHAMVSGTTYTFSVFAKAGTSDNLYFTMGNVRNGPTFTFSTATWSTVANWTTTVQAVGNGWYRISASTASNSTQSNTMQMGIGTSGQTVLIFGAQSEALAFPTSYIPTVASQVTRAQDFATMTGTNFSSWFNNNQGTVYCSFDVASSGTNSPYMAPWGIDNGSVVGYDIQKNSGNSAVTAYEGNAVIPNIGSITAINTTQQSIYTFNNTSGSLGFSGILNGGTVGSTTAQPLSYIPTQMSLGAMRSSNYGITGHIRKFAYYPIATTSAQLQALTGS